NLRHGKPARFPAVRRFRGLSALLLVLAVAGLFSAHGCAPSRPAPVTSPASSPAPSPSNAPASPAGTPDELPIAADVAERVAQFPATKIDYDRSLLDDRETAALQLLIEASKEF